MTTLIHGWGQLLDTLDSSGGHLALLLVLMLIGVGMVHLGIEKGEDVMIGAFGALLGALRTAQSNQARANGKEPA